MTIPAWAVKGAKVVCVNANPRYTGHEWSDDMDGLREKAVYTIREVVRFSYDGRICVKLDEIVRPSNRAWQGEAAYDASRFRPVTTTKTQAEDVAMIRDLIKQTEDA